ncbi:putative threonine aspartase [Smittium culicis]|uniref:Putative threonine aspartase n=1 Tax=Smittium culicis TaxID=133412 RepID=A0A1R1X3G3_9FUNG|nr:putative threonine aspartase [Smittium culicis]
MHNKFTIPHNKENSKEQLESISDIDVFEDTVGAVCLDFNGNIASGVSSGGIAIKLEGRVGEAAIYKSGCWAQTYNNEGIETIIGSSVTGTFI